MVSTYDRGLLLVAVGVVLLLNPAYLYPHGGPRQITHEFRATQTDPSALDDDLLSVDESLILVCTGITHHRACLLERQVGTDGTLTVENATVDRNEEGEVRLSKGYRYLYLESGATPERTEAGFYAPRANESNGSVVLWLERVDRSTVLREFVTEYRSALPVVRRAVAEGSATTTLSVSELDPETVRREQLRDAAPTIVRRDGDYYVVREVHYASRRSPIAKHLTPIRTVAVFAGALLVFRAFQLPAE